MYHQNALETKVQERLELLSRLALIRKYVNYQVFRYLDICCVRRLLIVSLTDI
ncbi:hypothetical protein NIES4071_106290 (plasmid) [Calothrix sp. NIES-4071]|nr:hypothetical protein NIES4071_106290 [Calothrix sp. NIES-4071]BAZ65047.1 hypothetical protein NIES4105_107800 [Calothrix sp. NIES-4105]